MFYYVGVRVPEGMAFVTQINTVDRSVEFKLFHRPIEFTDEMAFFVCKLLRDRLYLAVVVISPDRLKDHPFSVCYR